MSKIYYVSMTDKFMSGWGRARGKINKLVFECENYSEALIVLKSAQDRSEMKYINICYSKPYYNSNRYFVQYKTREEAKYWYKEK